VSAPAPALPPPEVDETAPGAQAPTRWVLGGLLVGLAAVAAAAAAGLLLAAGLHLLGVVDTSPWTSGPWLAGAGLLGGWRQDVTSDVAGGVAWSTWVSGAPLLVTAVAAWVAAALARRLRLSVGGVLVAMAAAAATAYVLVLVSDRTTRTVDDAGTVTVKEGLTTWWTAGWHPGTVTGAALLVGVVGVVATVGGDWWRSGRAVAFGTLVVPGVLITLASAAGLWWLTSSASLAGAAVLLAPLLGTAVLLAAGGAPAELGLTRISPEPHHLSTWTSGWLAVLAGLALCVVVSVLVGLVLRRRGHTGTMLAGVTVTAGLALSVTAAMVTTVVVPPSLGGATVVATLPPAAAVVAAGMAAIALLVRGRPRAPRRPPSPPAS